MKLLQERKNRKYPFQKDSDLTNLKKQLPRSVFFTDLSKIQESAREDALRP